MVLGDEFAGAYVIIKSSLTLHGPLMSVRDPELSLIQSLAPQGTRYIQNYLLKCV